MNLLWKDDGSTMSWDHFSWDSISVPQDHMKKVKTGMNGKADPAILPIANSIIAGATGKVELANSPVTLVTLGDQRDDADTAYTAEVQAKEAWLMKRTERRTAFKELRTSVNRFALHANAVYVGDKASLQALGLDVVEIAGLVGVLPGPANLRAIRGVLEGSIVVRWRKVRGTDNYVLECAETATGPWTESYRGSGVTATCAGLVPGKEYFFRVQAWGTAGGGAWSDITKMRAN